MNAVALNPFYGMSTDVTSQSTSGTTSISTEFGAIIEQLLAGNNNVSAMMMQNGTQEGIEQLLLQLFGSEEVVSQDGITQLLSQLFGNTESLEENSEVDTDLNAMMMAAGVVPMQTTTTTDAIQILEQMFTQDSSSLGFSQLMQVISQMSAPQQQQFMENLLNNSQQTASSSVYSNLPTTANETSSTTTDKIQQLIKLLGGEVSIAQQPVSQTGSAQLDSFSDTLARLHITNAVKPSTEQPAEEQINLESLQQSLTTSNPLTTLPSDSTTPSANKAQNIAMQLTQGMQNLTENKAFTVKLSPEGLGDITVSLTETSGKMSLVLTATSPETARLLNSELAILQATLKPYQSEAEPIIVVQTTQSETGNDYISNGFTQQQQTDNKPDNSLPTFETGFTDEQEIQETLAQITSSLLSTRV